jgi:multiple antibiotic resistance protein
MFLPFIQVFFAIFGVMDPVGNVPMFLSLTAKLERKEQQRLATSAVKRAGVILVAFVFLGSAILNAFQISIESFRIAGGLILCILGLQILFGPEHEAKEGDGGDISVVPLATPLIAGPGTITSSVILVKEYGYLLVLAAVIVNLVLTRLLFKYAYLVLRLLGKKGAQAFAKVMGLIIVAIGVEFIRNALGAK